MKILVKKKCAFCNNKFVLKTCRNKYCSEQCKKSNKSARIRDIQKQKENGTWQATEEQLITINPYFLRRGDVYKATSARTIIPKVKVHDE